MSTAAQKAAAQAKLDDAIRSDPFMASDGFAQIDLRGCPSMTPLLESEESWDDGFAPLDTRGSGAGSRDLKAFIEHETVRAQGPGEVNLGKGVIGKVVHDGKEWLCDFTYQGKLRRTKAADYDDCVMQASRFIFNHRPDIRKLDAEEEQLVTWIAQSGRPDAGPLAAEKYLSFAITNAGALGMRVLTDPKYAETVDEAVFYAWSRATDSYSLSDREFPKFLRRFARHKRLTMSVCDAAWIAYKSEVAAQERAALFEQPAERAPERGDIENLTDDEVKRTYQAVAREFARR